MRPGEGGGSSKPPKKRTPPRTGSMTEPGAHITPSFNAPSSNAPVKAPSFNAAPSYARPPLLTPKQPSILDAFRKPKSYERIKPKAPSLSDVISGNLPTDPTPDAHSRLQQILSGIDTDAPVGYTPGAERLKSGEFAWVPDRFKRANGRLKNYWDRDFIESSADDFKYPSQYQNFLNGIMEQQFKDRENWLLDRRFKRSTHIQNVLANAGQAAYEGNFDYLSDYMEKHPKFSTTMPEYGERFGVTPEMVTDAWEKHKNDFGNDYDKGAARYKMDVMRRHYDKLRSQYDKGNQFLEDAVKRYEKKYNKSVDFRDAKDAGPALPDRGPQIDPETQELINKAGDAADPNSNWLDLYADGLGAVGYKKEARANYRRVRRARRKAMATLGVQNLPSVKEMLSYEVANGTLDPNDEAAVEAAIDKFQNPNHPDTRAMFLSYAMGRNPELDAEGVGLDFVNAPIKRYAKAQEELAQDNEDFEREQDASTIDGPIDFITDAWKRPGSGGRILDVRAGGGGAGVSGGDESTTNQLGWTFDKLARLNYAVAGMSEAWFNLDKDKGRSWVDKFGTDGLLLGQSWASSFDDVLEDPSGLGQVAKAGYQQTFRGSSLPGTDDDIVPITFSNVIANNADRNDLDGVYDEDWYQHVVGFAFDVAYDPLNLIGVGIVDDSLKVPARLAKGLSKAGKEDQASVETLEFLNRVEAPDMSPVPEKVFRVNQSISRLGDDVGGTPLAADADIERAFDTASNIKHQLTELKQQEAKLRNDLGTQTLHEELDEITSQSAFLSRKPELRVQRLAARNATRIQGSDLYNPGGRFWRDWIQPLQDAAKSRGFYDVKYSDTVAGQAAQKASQQLDQLLDDIDAGKLNAGDPAVVQKREALEDAVYNKAYERDPETGVVPVTHEVQYDKYFEAGTPGFKSGFDPVHAFADAMGVTKEHFLQNFSERDVFDALSNGPRMYAESDEAAGAILVEAQDRIAEAKRLINNPQIPQYKKDAAYKALQIGYQQMSEVALGGAMHYLDSLQDLRWANTEKGLMRGGLQEELDGINRQISEFYDRTGFVNDDVGDYYGGFQGQLGKRENPELDELTSERARIQQELEDIGLQEAVPSKLPPAAAYRLDEILPQESVFRNSDGSIATEKVKDSFKIQETGDGLTHHVTYTMPEGATNDDVAFLDRLRGAIESEYNANFRRFKTEMLNYRKTGKLEGEPPVGLGPREQALGPRPTAETMRNRLPEYSKRELKGNTEDVRESTVLGKDGWLHTDEDVVIDKATGAKSTEQRLDRTGGKRTARQKGWENNLKAEQRRYDRALARARELDRAARTAPDPDFKLNKTDFGIVQKKAFGTAIDNTLDTLKQGKIKRLPGNMRLTIRESADNMVKRLNMEHKAKDLSLRIQQAEARNADEFKQLDIQRKALEKKYRKAVKEVEKAKKRAYETKAAAKRVVGEEHVLQIAAMPPRATGKMIQFRIAGMRKNVQFTNNLFRGAEKAGELIPAKFRENYANYFARPTKQLDSREAILFRAQWESKTPVIIKAHLERLSHRMRDIPDHERVEMMKAYRKGYEYEGPKMQHSLEVEAELNEIASIWNGSHEFYKFRDLGSAKPTSLAWGEIYRFLPSDYQPNLKVLSRLVADDPNGAVKVDYLIEAIKANGGKVQDLLDPFRFSWVMRLAADQARQYRALTHSIANTFGVRIGPAGTDRYRVLSKLKQNYEWQQHPEFGDYLFPPESANDVKKLLEFAEPGEAHNKISQLFDKAQGYWKQSMTIYNPGYYTRNGVGEIMASWLDGVNHPKWYRMAYRVHRFTKGADRDLAALVKKWSVLDGHVPVDEAKGGEVLFTLKGGQKVTVEDALRHYINTGLKSTFANTDLDRGVRGLANASLSQGPVRKLAGKVNENVHDLGEGFEDYLRMAHFLHAMQHSGRGDLFSAAKYAAERVRKYHFDYTDFGTFEKTVMLRAFPFYKWTRRGAPLMLAHLFMTPGKMVAIPKAMDAVSGLGFDPMGVITDDPVLSTSDVHDDNNGVLPNYSGIAPGWVRDLFAYQMQPADDDEYNNYFRIQTPQIDGLNAVLGLTPGGNNGIAEIFGDSAANPLLSPAIKMPTELGLNRSLDPDFPYEIYGGEYNEMNGINPVESIINYTARSLNPDVGFLTKMSKNGQLPIGNMGDGSYRDEHGYDGSRDVASFVTGAGFYQAMHDKPDESNDTAVGLHTLDSLPHLAGRKAAPKQSGKDRSGAAASLDDILSTYQGSGSSSVGNGNGSGWIDYPDRPWINFGSGGFSSGSYGGSSDSGSFMELIRRLKQQIDQGDVID